MYGKSHYHKAYLDDHQIAMQCDTWIIRAMTKPIQDDIVFFETIASHGLDVTPLNHPLYVHRGKIPKSSVSTEGSISLSLSFAILIVFWLIPDELNERWMDQLEFLI